jgi:hypothetical protein
MGTETRKRRRDSNESSEPKRVSRENDKLDTLAKIASENPGANIVRFGSV